MMTTSQKNVDRTSSAFLFLFSGHFFPKKKTRKNFLVNQYNGGGEGKWFRILNEV